MAEAVAQGAVVKADIEENGVEIIDPDVNMKNRDMEPAEGAAEASLNQNGTKKVRKIAWTSGIMTRTD